MQIRSILEAAAIRMKQHMPIKPEIMAPRVITVQELKKVKEWVDVIRAEVEDKYRPSETVCNFNASHNLKCCLKRQGRGTYPGPLGDLIDIAACYHCHSSSASSCGNDANTPASISGR